MDLDLQKLSSGVFSIRVDLEGDVVGRELSRPDRMTRSMFDIQFQTYTAPFVDTSTRRLLEHDTK